MTVYTYMYARSVDTYEIMYKKTKYSLEKLSVAGKGEAAAHPIPIQGICMMHQILNTYIAQN